MLFSVFDVILSYFTIFYAILRYFTLIVDSMVSYLREVFIKNLIKEPSKTSKINSLSKKAIMGGKFNIICQFFLSVWGEGFKGKLGEKGNRKAVTNTMFQ